MEPTKQGLKIGKELNKQLNLISLEYTKFININKYIYIPINILSYLCLKFKLKKYSRIDLPEPILTKEIHSLETK